jgi:hypothetical protein
MPNSSRNSHHDLWSSIFVIRYLDGRLLIAFEETNCRVGKLLLICIEDEAMKNASTLRVAEIVGTKLNMLPYVPSSSPLAHAWDSQRHYAQKPVRRGAE